MCQKNCIYKNRGLEPDLVFQLQFVNPWPRQSPSSAGSLGHTTVAERKKLELTEKKSRAAGRETEWPGACAWAQAYEGTKPALGHHIITQAPPSVAKVTHDHNQGGPLG